MQRIATPTRAVDLHGPGKDGFTGGDPATGILATRLDAAWFNGTQEEIAHVIEQAGITLDGEDLTQLYQAIQVLIAAGQVSQTVPLGALPYATVVTADHRIAITGAAVAGTGGTVSVPAGVSILLGEDAGDGTGTMRSVTTSAWTSAALAANATYYLRGRINAGGLELYVQQGTDADAVPAGLTGTPDAAVGGGFDSTQVDVLLARVLTGPAGSSPAVTPLANAARLHLAASVSVGLNPLLSWTTYPSAAVALNWARRPAVCLPSMQFIAADSGAPMGSDLTSSGSGALQMIGVRSASVNQTRYSTGGVEVAYDDTANNGGVVHIAWTVEA